MVLRGKVRREEGEGFRQDGRVRKPEACGTVENISVFFDPDDVHRGRWWTIR